MPAQYLAFDLGASSGRAVLGTLEGGRMQMDEVHRFPTPLLKEGGSLWWDLESLWFDLEVGLEKALASAPGLRSLSVDSWAVDYVSLDAAGALLRRPYAYRDARTDGMLERAYETMSRSAIWARTGVQFLPFNTLYQLLADQGDDPAGLEDVSAHALIADYFNYRFSGRLVIERTNASTTQLVSARSGEWDAELFEAFGLKVEPWPEIVPPGTRLGVARRAPSVAVVASCSHDTGSAVAAAPATGDDWAFVSCGTWSLLGAVLDGPILTEAALDAGFTNEAGLDGTVRFLTNLTGLWALQECAREWGVADWSALEDEAAAADPPVAPIDLEDARFVARGNMEERVRAAYRGQGQPEPQTRGEVARLVLASIAASYRRALRALEDVTGRSYATLHVFGGGSQNSLLCQLTADACGVRVVAGPAEATALGNLIVQARTMGDLGGLTIREVARQSSDLHDYHPTSDHERAD